MTGRQGALVSVLENKLRKHIEQNVSRRLGPIFAMIPLYRRDSMCETRYNAPQSARIRACKEKV